MSRTKSARCRLRERRPGRGTGRARAWQSIRILRRFTLPEIVATAEVSYWNAKRYVQRLTRAGFLRVAVPVASGKKGGHQIWQLVRNSGPYAPCPQSDGGVWDPNTHEVIR